VAADTVVFVRAASPTGRPAGLAPPTRTWSPRDRGRPL